VAYAVEASLLTAFAWNGPTALATCLPSAASSTNFSITARLSAAVTFCPPGATNTTRALAPSAAVPGKRCSSRSNAFCDSIPGIVDASSEAPGALAAPKPTAASTATHSRATYQRRRKARRPSR
jgi:hypothetical protein